MPYPTAVIRGLSQQPGRVPTPGVFGIVVGDLDVQPLAEVPKPLFGTVLGAPAAPPPKPVVVPAPIPVVPDDVIPCGAIG
jgi:hypothetical protein